jgi:Ribonuclease G/E
MLTQRDIDEITVMAINMADEIDEMFNLMLAGDRRQYLEDLFEITDLDEVENAAAQLQELLSRQGQV